MFNPIENGTIFDMTLTLILGVILGICINILYSQMLLYLGTDPLEKGGYKKLIKHIAGQAKALFRSLIGRS